MIKNDLKTLKLRLTKISTFGLFRPNLLFAAIASFLLFEQAFSADNNQLIASMRAYELSVHSGTIEEEAVFIIKAPDEKNPSRIEIVKTCIPFGSEDDDQDEKTSFQINNIINKICGCIIYDAMQNAPKGGSHLASIKLTDTRACLCDDHLGAWHGYLWKTPYWSAGKEEKKLLVGGPKEFK